MIKHGLRKRHKQRPLTDRTPSQSLYTMGIPNGREQTLPRDILAISENMQIGVDSICYRKGRQLEHNTLLMPFQSVQECRATA